MKLAACEQTDNRLALNATGKVHDDLEFLRLTVIKWW